MILKYFSLISVPLFGIISFVLIRQVSDFSLTEHTISKTIRFLHHPKQLMLFRLNFLLKTILDGGFVWYVSNYFHLPWYAPVVLMMSIAVMLFGALAYITDDAHVTLHYLLVYGAGALWMFSQLLLAYMIGDTWFITATLILAVVPVLVAFGFLVAKKTNALVQIGCMAMIYSWHALFVFRYL